MASIIIELDTANAEIVSEIVAALEGVLALIPEQHIIRSDI